MEARKYLLQINTFLANHLPQNTRKYPETAGTHVCGNNTAFTGMRMFS